MHRASSRRGFPLFWAGRATSQFGDQITLLALPWLVAETTRSELATGALEAVVFVPVLLLGLPIGAFADRRSRRRSMIEADILRAFVLVTLPLAVLLGGDAGLAHVLIVALLVGIGNALFESSAQAFLTDLVPRADLIRANSRLSLTEGLAEVAGPAVAGALIAVLGATGALAVDAATFAASALALVAIHRLVERHGERGRPVAGAVREGLEVVFGDRRLRALTLTQAGANLGSGIIGGLVIFFFQQDLGLSGWETGVAYAVNGAGGVLASLLYPRVTARLGVARTVLVGLGVGTAGFALVAVATPTTWQWTVTVGMGLVGLGVVSVVIAAATLRQLIVPSEALGRVTATYRTVVNGAIAIGALMGGLIGHVAGARAGLVAGTAVYGLVSLLGVATALNAADPADSSVSP